MIQLKLNQSTIQSIIIVALLVFIFLKGCNSSNKENETRIEVTVPEEKGILPQKEPKHSSIKDYIKDSIIVKDSIVYIENPVNQKLLKENQRLIDSFNKASALQKVEIYQEAIAINDFNYQEENSYLSLHITGKVRGRILSMLPSYTIKERIYATPIKTPQVKFRLLAGGEIGLNKNLDQFTYKLNLGFQNQKGNILRASYQRIGSEEYFLGGYDISIFKIKK